MLNPTLIQETTDDDGGYPYFNCSNIKAPKRVNAVVLLAKHHTALQLYRRGSCNELISEHEKRRGRGYEWYIYTRPDLFWLGPHPPLEMFRKDKDRQQDAHLWVVQGYEFGGYSDTHIIADEKLEYWKPVVDGSLEKVLWTVDWKAQRRCCAIECRHCCVPRKDMESGNGKPMPEALSLNPETAMKLITDAKRQFVGATRWKQTFEFACTPEQRARNSNRKTKQGATQTCCTEQGLRKNHFGLSGCFE